MLVGNSRTPDPSNPSTYQWSSHYDAQGQALVIRRDDPNWPEGDPAVFYIGTVLIYAVLVLSV